MGRVEREKDGRSKGGRNSASWVKRKERPTKASSDSDLVVSSPERYNEEKFDHSDKSITNRLSTWVLGILKSMDTESAERYTRKTQNRYIRLYNLG